MPSGYDIRPAFRRLPRTGVARAALALLVMAASWDAVGARRIDVGGHRLRLLEKGRGQPTVVFDAGLGDSLETWSEVWPEVARFTRVFLYDRAGLGRSDEGPEPRTSGRMVEELHTLLLRAKVEPPYVLVGHSLGGLNVRLFASRHPDEVAGLLLVDATPVAFPAWFDEDAASRTRLEALMAAAPPGTRGEYESIGQSADEVRDAGPPPPAPVVVISSRRPEEDERFRAMWLSLQREMAAAVDATEHRVVEESGHYVQQDAPDVVIEAIRRLVELGRR